MTYAQLESWAAENESVEEFLAGATAWRADPGRRDDGLQDRARRMIYRVMKTASFDMTAQTFGKWSGVRVFSLLQDRINFTLFCQQQQLQRLSAAMVKETGHYASLAVLSAHPGFTAVSGGITSPFWTWFDEPLNLNQPIRAWFSAPFHLRIQDCEAAFRRVADTNLSTDAVPTVAPTFAAPQASATPPTAASPAPFYFTGGTLAAADVRVKATAPTTAFPFSAPVVGYKGLTTGDVQRSESAKPCCTRTCRLRKSRVQWLKGLPKAFRLRSIKACHLGRLRVLQGRAQSQNRALLQSAKAGCSETHVRQNKSKKKSTTGFVREELRPGYPDWTARTGASGEERQPVYKADTGAAGVQSAATESTTLPDFTQYPGLARLKISLLPHDGHAPPAMNLFRLPPLPFARSGVAVPEVRDLSHVQPVAAELTTLPGPTLPTAMCLAPQPTAAPPTQAAAPWPTPAMRDFSHMTYVLVRRGMYNHIVTSQLVGPAEDILEYNAIGRLGFSPRIRGHVY